MIAFVCVCFVFIVGYYVGLTVFGFTCSCHSLIATIMDKSPWDSQSITSILCVSQVMS